MGERVRDSTSYRTSTVWIITVGHWLFADQNGSIAMSEQK